MEDEKMTYSPDSCACFTGHRAMSSDEMKKASLLISREVTELYDRGIYNYYAGGALGFDFAASVTVLNMKAMLPKLTLNLALPCRDYMKKWSFSQTELFERVMARADSVVYVSEEYSRGCMQVRNRYMVDRSGVCIAYLKESRGGTYNTVGYAKKKGVKVINLAGNQYADQICLDL